MKLIPNPTTLQQALNEANQQILDLPTNLQILIDPDLCPVQFLPFLAWSESVDYWDEAWPETTKRTAIKEARYIHHKKGTQIAIEKLLAMVGFELTTLTEWFNHTPPKTAGTFSAQVAAPDGINLKTQALMRRMIEIGKPASRHLVGLVVSLQSKGIGFNAAHCIKGQTLSVYPYMPTNKQSSGSAYQAAQNYQIIILHSEEQPL